jgi:hypothetical protein
MKVDGLDWIDWLHKTREESERERMRRGISGSEWLKEIRARAEAFKRERASREAPVARDSKDSTGGESRHTTSDS